jgi:hypothetical protein
MRLLPLPEGFVQTRGALHQVAFFVLGPVRYQAVGRMGLQAAPGGFGTPEFDGRLARVEGATLVYEQPDQIASQTITTVRAAAEFVGIEYQVDWYEGFRDPLNPVDPDSPLDVDDTAARALGQWFKFGFEALDSLRGQADAEDDVSEVQLWPEHFDPATELGSEENGRRASYGASPGDPSHEEPYLYVAAWGEIDRSSPYWNDESFNGASLGYSALTSTEDPVQRALEFLLEGYRAIHTT